MKIFVLGTRSIGQSDTFNKGLGIASGEIIDRLNSNDIYLPGTIHKVVEVFEIIQKFL